MNTTNLVPGTYSATIELGIGRADGSIIAYKDVAVTYTVFTVTSSPDAINFTTNSAVAPASQNLVLGPSADSSAWTSSIGYTSGAPGWLDLSSSSGSMLPASITVNASSMPTGVYRASISFSVDGTVTIVPVTLTVSVPQVNFVSPYVAVTNVGGDVIVRGYGFLGIENAALLFGTTPATAISVISDTEIRATYPPLPRGNYPATVQNATQSLPSRAQLVVVDPPSYSYVAISRSAPMPGGVTNSNLIYDAERQAIYVCDTYNDRVERYRFDGTGWLTDPALSSGYLYNSGGIELSPDGKEILRRKFRSITHIDPVSWSVTAEISSEPVLGTETYPNQMAITNDGTVVGNATATAQSVSFLMYKYDTLLREFFRLATPSGMTEFNNVNRIFGSPADGSKLLLATYGWGGTMYSYNAGNGEFATTPVSTFATYDISMSRTGAGSIIQTDFGRQTTVYDAQFNVLGSLPQPSAFVISPDGGKAYTYVSSTGMVHAYDLSSSNGSGGFAEIGAGTSVPDSLGSGHQMAMAISPDGQTLFLAGYQRVIVMPAP